MKVFFKTNSKESIVKYKYCVTYLYALLSTYFMLNHSNLKTQPFNILKRIRKYFGK